MPQRVLSRRTLVNTRPVLSREWTQGRADGRTILSPICACGLATAVYASVLLTLTLFTDPSATSDQLQERIQGVEILLQPLQDTGQMWETVQVMAGESCVSSRLLQTKVEPR